MAASFFSAAEGWAMATTRAATATIDVATATTFSHSALPRTRSPGGDGGTNDAGRSRVAMAVMRVPFRGESASGIRRHQHAGDGQHGDGKNELGGDRQHEGA